MALKLLNLKASCNLRKIAYSKALPERDAFQLKN
jgi:hypothetical protein